MPKSNKTTTAVFYAFLKCYGGGEKLMFQIRDYFEADFWIGAIDSTKYGSAVDNSFAEAAHKGPGKLITLHEEVRFPFLHVIVRQLHFLFNPHIVDLLNYETIIFSGNISWVAKRLRRLEQKQGLSRRKMIAFVHTPPRILTDERSKITKFFPKFLKIIPNKIIDWGLDYAYTSELKCMDVVLTNSTNIQNRLKTYTGIDSQWIFPPADLDRFEYIDTKDYYISYSRLEEPKRIPLILEAFAQMPEKKLVICSTGPLKNWLQDEISIRKLHNITYEGLVSDERLKELVGNSITGITIPRNEDAGITQLEIMAAGIPSYFVRN